MVKADELVAPVANTHDRLSVADTASVVSAVSTPSFSTGYGVIDKRYSGKAIHWTSLANRILYSRYYVLLYIFIFLMSGFLLVWGLMYHQFLDNIGSEEVWYIALDVFTSVVLVFEIALRIVATHETFWRSWINRLDVVVVIVVAGSLLLHIVDPESIGVIGSAVLTVRYATQIVRLIIVVKLHRDRQLWLKAAADNFIDFNNIEYTETAREVGIVPPGYSAGSEGLLRETVTRPELIVSAAGSKYRFRIADMDHIREVDESIDDAWQVVSIDGTEVPETSNGTSTATPTPHTAPNGAVRPEFASNGTPRRLASAESQSTWSGASRTRRVPQRHKMLRREIPKDITILVEEELPADGRILNAAGRDYRQASRTFDQTNSGRTYEEYYASEDDSLLYPGGSGGGGSRRAHLGTTASLPAAAGTYAQYQTVDTIDEGGHEGGDAVESSLTPQHHEDANYRQQQNGWRTAAGGHTPRRPDI